MPQRVVQGDFIHSRHRLREATTITLPPPDDLHLPKSLFEPLRLGRNADQVSNRISAKQGLLK